MKTYLHLAALTVVLVAAVAAAPAWAQNSGARTPDGQPDIQGVWTNFDPTPFEAPSDIDLERSTSGVVSWHQPAAASACRTCPRCPLAWASGSLG